MPISSFAHPVISSSTQSHWCNQPTHKGPIHSFTDFSSPLAYTHPIIHPLTQWRARRGSWMPEANEVLECPQINFFLSINSSPKNSDDCSYSFLQILPSFLFYFCDSSPKFTYSSYILKNIFGMPPYPGCPGPSPSFSYF